MKLVQTVKTRTNCSEQAFGTGRIKLAVLLVLLALVNFSCKKEESKQDGDALKAKKIASKVNVKYAKGFDIDYYEGYKILHVFRPYRHKDDTISYLLYPRGTQKPAGFEDMPSVQIPAKKIITLFSPHVAQIDFLEATDALVGVASKKYLVNTRVKELIKEGKVAEVSSGGSLNAEIVFTLGADFIMASGTTNSEFDHFENIMRNGTPVVYQSAWMEASMLARAEWVKVVAALLDKEELANQKFEETERKYNELLALVKENVTERPKVIAGLPFKGTWYVGSGNTYAGRLMEDAGVDWPWADDDTPSSLRLDFETIYPHGLEADFWINIGYMDSKEQLMGIDSRFTEFLPVKNGNLYNNRKRLSPDNAGNEYWESSMLHPHLVLSDLIKIFHPELLPDYELYYYKQLQ